MKVEHFFESPTNYAQSAGDGMHPEPFVTHLKVFDPGSAGKKLAHSLSKVAVVFNWQVRSMQGVSEEAVSVFQHNFVPLDPLKAEHSS